MKHLFQSFSFHHQTIFRQFRKYLWHAIIIYSRRYSRPAYSKLALNVTFPHFFCSQAWLTAFLMSHDKLHWIGEKEMGKQYREKRRNWKNDMKEGATKEDNYRTNDRKITRNKRTFVSRKTQKRTQNRIKSEKNSAEHYSTLASRRAQIRKLYDGE